MQTNATEASPRSDETCPECRLALEIVAVKFRLSGTAMVARCPNCSAVVVQGLREREPNLSKRAQAVRVQWMGELVRRNQTAS